MTNDETAFREVDAAVAEDRQAAFFRTYGTYLIGGAAAIVIGVGGWQAWSARQSAMAEQAALEFATATETLQQNQDDGRIALETLANGAPEGYALMAEMRRAASLAASDRPGALVIYRGIYGDGAAPDTLRELARLRAASLAVADGRDAVLSDLGSLTEGRSPFSHYARELSAFAALEAKDYETAYEMFERASSDLEAPEPVRQRAREFAALAAAGKSGVNLTGDARVDDLLQALGDAAREGAAAGENSDEDPADSQAAGGDTGEDPADPQPEDELATGEDQ